MHNLIRFNNIRCLMRCSSYCTADQYDIDALSKYLRSTNHEPTLYDEVLHVRVEGEGDAFYFPYGCIVFWGFEQDAEFPYVGITREFETDSLPHFIQDECLAVNGSSTLINKEEDEIVLGSNDVLVKFSFSHALSQSVKLTAFEESVKKTISATRHLPRELASKGKISLSSRKIAQQLGLLFAERNSINLHSDILDTPEFFWRRPKYEVFYKMGAEYLDLAPRLNILNQRLDVVRELYEVLTNELQHLHSSRLELVIIFLIATEIAITLLKDFFHAI